MEEFKAGEEVFSARSGWTTLMENDNNYSSIIYPLKTIDGHTYTKEGKKLEDIECNNNGGRKGCL